MQCTLLFFLTGTATVADISALNASLLKPDIKSVSHSASWLSSLLSMLGVMMLRIAFTFLCLTAAEPCSEFDPFCAAKGHELLQRQKLLKMETENLMSYEEFEASVKDSYATGQKRLKRSDFLVEKDFASFHHPAYRAFTKDESCMENVQKGIHHFGKTTGLADELNSTELEALMARVMEEMEIFCKHDHIENITDPDVQSAQFMKDFVETLTHEKPLMTSRLMEQLVANSEGNYTFDFPDWLLNFSMLDLHDRTGREIENTSHGLLLMQTQSYTEKMKRRSLPATFDSRTAWPACGDWPHPQPRNPGGVHVFIFKYNILQEEI